MTFFVNQNHRLFGMIFSKNSVNHHTASRIWLRSMVTLNNNILLSDHLHTNSEMNFKMLIRLVRNIGVHIEQKLRELIHNDWTDVYDWIVEQWPKAKDGVFVKFEFPEDETDETQYLVVHIEVENRMKEVSIDIITGLFLVDGLRVDRLPRKICKNPLYQRTFGDYSFEVQPDDRRRYSTVHEFDSRVYEFELLDTDVLIINECHANDTWELIPPELFENEIPVLLIEKYSHWWNKVDTIEFRPKKFTDPQFSNDSGVEYVLNTKSNRLIQSQTNRPMLDIKSDSSKKIQQHLSRLERPENIHIFMDTPKVAKIELTRLNLKFRIDTTKKNEDGSFDMLSNEFSRIRVSLQQNCGTLYGLNHGLMLENVPNVNGTFESKHLIIPHTKITSSRTKSIMNVDVDLGSDLRMMAFHRYQVDDTLRQLKPTTGSFSAWFYLAYLHAITSHGEIEPLTGMSGTERALQILQSSFAWSSSPYDNEALQTLQLIASLTPDRTFTENIQRVKWPKRVQRHCAQDTFYFIVDKLINDSHRLSKLYPAGEKIEWKRPRNISLNVRDYYRLLQLKPNLRVQNIFIKHPVLMTKTLPTIEMTAMNNVRRVSSLYHANTFKVPNLSSLDLKKILLICNSIDGPIYVQKMPNYMNHNMQDIPLKDLWISLYEVARNQLLDREQFGFLWSLLAFYGGRLDLILALQAISQNSIEFQNIEPPKVKKYRNPWEQFDKSEVMSILNSNFYSNGTNAVIAEIATLVESEWPCDRIDLCHKKLKNFKRSLNEKLNEKLLQWNNNKRLNDFIDRVVIQLKQLKESRSVTLPKIIIKYPSVAENKKKFEINLEEKIRQRFKKSNEVIEAKGVWQMEKTSQRTSAEWLSIYDKIVNSESSKHLRDAGMYPRVVPILILPKLISDDTEPNMKAIIGASALSMAQEQQKHRDKIAESRTISRKPVANTHKNDQPHLNWKPSAYPEWLLFEIERDLAIRRIQIDIAKRMINPPEIGKKHSVMQLNMGEGKTSVIVPILASVLANGEQACQIIVLKSLFATNLNALRLSLGGMLNRRIYTLPCRRDLPMEECVAQLEEIYEECKRMKGKYHVDI